MSMGLSAGAISLIGAGASIAAPVIGGMIAGDSASAAAEAQARGAAQANGTLQANYDRTRGDFSGYMGTGTAANNKLATFLGIGGAQGDKSRQTFYDDAFRALDAAHQREYGMGFNQSPDEASKAQRLRELNAQVDQQYADYQKSLPDPSTDPNYGMLTRQFTADDLAKDVPYTQGLQFGLAEGTKGINNMAAATGSQLSGATLKALTRFGNDYATTKTAGASDRYTQRQNQIYGMFSGTSNAGQQAAGAVANAGQGAASGIANNQTGLGNAQGAAEIASGNALSGALNGAYSNYQGNKLINSLTQRGSSGYGLYTPSEAYSGYNATVGLAPQ